MLDRLRRIEVLIHSTDDKKQLRLLNKAWWDEFFRLMEAK